MNYIMKYIVALVPVLALLPLPSINAAPLEPSEVPSDAKWVMHVDFDELRETRLMKRIEKTMPEAIEAVRGWMSSEYGIEPQSDLHSLTMYGQIYELHSGTAVLRASFDSEKVTEKLENNDDLKQTKWKDRTLYTKQEDDPNTVTIMPLDGKFSIFASTPKKVKQAAKLIQRNGDSLKGSDSPLVRDVPQGSVFYGAAIELQKIRRHDGPFPILRQHEQVIYAIGNDGEYVFEELMMTASSDEVAKEMKAVLDGWCALLKLWAADSKALQRIPADLTIELDGREVTSTYRGSVEDVSEAFSAVGQRWMQWAELDSSKK